MRIRCPQYFKYSLLANSNILSIVLIGSYYLYLCMVYCVVIQIGMIEVLLGHSTSMIYSKFLQQLLDIRKLYRQLLCTYIHLIDLTLQFVCVFIIAYTYVLMVVNLWLSLTSPSCTHYSYYHHWYTLQLVLSTLSHLMIITILHYLLNITKYFMSNTQLLFIPGQHHLHSDLTLQHFTHWQYTAQKALIQSNYIIYINVQYV